MTLLKVSGEILIPRIKSVQLEGTKKVKTRGSSERCCETKIRRFRCISHLSVILACDILQNINERNKNIVKTEIFVILIY